MMKQSMYSNSVNYGQAYWTLLQCFAVVVYLSFSVYSTFVAKNLLDSPEQVSMGVFLASAQYVFVCSTVAWWTWWRRRAEDDCASHALPTLLFATYLLDVCTVRFTALEFYSAATSLTPAIVTLLAYKEAGWKATNSRLVNAFLALLGT